MLQGLTQDDVKLCALAPSADHDDILLRVELYALTRELAKPHSLDPRVILCHYHRN